MYKVAYNACYGGFSLSKEASEYLRDTYGVDIDPDYGYVYDIERHDPRLIETIEKFGEGASGCFSDLQIKEIESTMYRIDEYDGNEWVETPNDIKWVVIKETN